jgi:hypothetical protein
MRHIISADTDKFIRIWDVKNGEQVASLPGHRQGIMALDLSADGRTLASSSSDRTLRLWNLATYREVGRFEMELEPYRVTFSPDDSGLFFTQRGKTLTEPSTVLWRAPGFDESPLQRSDGRAD